MTMKSFKALSKQLFGAHYEQIPKSAFICAILFFALYAAEIRVAISPFILYFTATVFSAGVMWQSLSSSRNAEAMAGLFMLPFDSRRLTISYTLAFSTYTIITKTLLVLTLFFAAGTWNVAQIIISQLCAFSACAMTAAIYALIRQKRSLLALVWAAVTVAGILIGRQTATVFFVTLINVVTAALYLLYTDAYVFYHPASIAATVGRFRRQGSVFTYLLRYLFTNKNYLVNTLGLWAIACFLPFLLGQSAGVNTMPFGFAILCLNTPICVLLSCDPSLEQAIRVLPGQATRFCSRYCLFIALVNITASGIYLCSWQLQHGGIVWLDIMTAILFAFQSAILSVMLEWFYPLRKWKVESDLWHHPRKYIVPLLMMILAVLIGGWEWSIWVLLCVVTIEYCTVLFKARRI